MQVILLVDSNWGGGVIEFTYLHFVRMRMGGGRTKFG